MIPIKTHRIFSVYAVNSVSQFLFDLLFPLRVKIAFHLIQPRKTFKILKNLIPDSVNE